MTAYISKQLNTKEQPILLWVLLGVIAVLGLFYAYFLNAAIMSVVARESLQDNISLASANVGTLESQFLAVERPLTSNMMANYGLSVPKNVGYLDSGKVSGAILTFGSNI